MAMAFEGLARCNAPDCVEDLRMVVPEDSPRNASEGVVKVRRTDKWVFEAEHPDMSRVARQAEETGLIEPRGCA